jgi:hypothetical protein
VQRIVASRLGLSVATAAVALMCAAAPALGASREPLSVLQAALGGRAASLATAPAGSAAARATVSDDSAPAPVAVTSSAYGPEQTEAVARIIGGLDHGPELTGLQVDVATPEEVAARCGETVLACYFPDSSEMVVSGATGAAGGVPRDFAIAHEYGHAIANSQASELGSPMQTGTLRWATYERVCQLSRAGILYPGDQGGHYWQNPEEAFAETYAQLADPSAGVAWQFSSFLAPTQASLAMVAADVAHPWSGPQSQSWSGAVDAPARPSPARAWGTTHEGIGSAVALGPPPGTATTTVATPLDGEVSVDLQTDAATPLAVKLVDPTTGRIFAVARTDAAGAAAVGFQNCGNGAVAVEVRSLATAASFEATITKP